MSLAFIVVSILADFGHKKGMVFELFFVTKYLLVGASDMLWTGGSVDQWISDVCMPHQSDWIYYKTPIKFPVIKVNGMREDLIPIQLRRAIFILM